MPVARSKSCVDCIEGHGCVVLPCPEADHRHLHRPADTRHRNRGIRGRQCTCAQRGHRHERRVHDADTRVQPCTRLAGCHKPVATAPAAAQNALLLVVLVGFSSENFYPQLPIEMNHYCLLAAACRTDRYRSIPRQQGALRATGNDAACSATARNGRLYYVHRNYILARHAACVSKRIPSCA